VPNKIADKQQIKTALADIKSEDVSQATMDFLYDTYMHEMPYGTQKARAGDPEQWIMDHLDDIESDLEKRLEQ